jgi:capsular polysaccharide export protein
MLSARPMGLSFLRGLGSVLSKNSPIDAPALRSPNVRLHRGPGPLRSPFSSPFCRDVSETVTWNGGGWIDDAIVSSLEPALGPIRALVDQLVEHRIGGAFWAPPSPWPDQVDVVAAPARATELSAVLHTALQAADAERVGLLLPARGWAARARRNLQSLGLRVFCGEIDPWSMLDHARDVVTSGDHELGLLALVKGRRVQCVSPGYLTGWGLTKDGGSTSPRGRRDVEQIAAAALVDGVRYLDSFTGLAATCQSTVEQLAEWRRYADADRSLASLSGVAWWKQKRLRRFFMSDAPFIQQAKPCVDRAVQKVGAVGFWPSGAPADLPSIAHRAAVPLRRIEDGFIRSVGLGSDLLPPSSIVIDPLGIYYDPRCPSALEDILISTSFTAALRERAARLIERVRTNGLTKYNTGGEAFVRSAGRRTVLVPGQVEDDQSVLLAGAGITSNLDFLRRVRAEEPDAHVIYRPHPDVEAGNRVGAVPDDAVLDYANCIDRAASMPSLLDGVDAVHVLTSLAGFEALLRGREVVVHGQPFYAGWGLTRDLAAVGRRGRDLSIEDLVAGALILYPRYLDPVTGLLCPPEILIDRLAGITARASWRTWLLRALRRRFELGYGIRRASTRTTIMGRSQTRPRV